MTETPDEVIRHEATACAHCGKEVAGTGGEIVEKRQEVGLLMRNVYTEYRRIETKCPQCGKVTTGEFSGNIRSPIPYSPEVEALVGYRSVYQYIPYGRVAAMMREVFDLPLSEGTVDNMLRETGENGDQEEGRAERRCRFRGDRLSGERKEGLAVYCPG